MEYFYSEQLVGIFTAALGVLFAIYIRKNRRFQPGQEEVIEAYLVDMENITDRKEHRICKKLTTIGRMKRKDIDICVAGTTISSAHAQIEYRNGNFYLMDLRSSNGTYLNSGKEKITGEVYLKDGDTIIFDKYKFRFVIPRQSRQRVKQLDEESYNHTILRAP